MKIKTIEELKTIAFLCSETLNLPEKIQVDDMEVGTKILFLHDTFLPIIASYSNILSNSLYETNIIDLKVTKQKEGVCYCILEENDDDETEEDEGNLSKTVIVLIILDIFKYMFNLKPNIKVDFAEIMEIWKEKLDSMPEYQNIDVDFVNKELNLYNIKENMIKPSLKR